MTNPTHVSGTIKPLEWSSDGDDGYFARSDFGTYEVGDSDEDEYFVKLRGIVYLEWLGDFFESVNEAKQVAQDDYEARILAAIQPDLEADLNDGQLHDLEILFAKETMATVRRCALEVFGSNCAYPCDDVMRLAHAAIQPSEAGRCETSVETIIAVTDEIMSDLSGYMADDLSTDDRMEAADMVQRILAAIQPEAPSGWQPIDTAPKDENVLLAWLYEPTGVWVYQAGMASSSKGGWWHGQATHWQHLPELPK